MEHSGRAVGAVTNQVIIIVPGVDSHSPLSSMLSSPCKFSFPKAERRMSTSAILALRLPSLKFDSAGDYIFEIKMGRKCVAQATLYVRKVRRYATKQSSKKKGRKPSSRK